MNKYKLILLSFVALLIGCTKTPDLHENSGMTIRAVNPQLKSTTTDGVNVLWDSSDQIAIFAGKNDESSAVFTNTLNSPASSATFVHSNSNAPVKQGNNYQAIYPASQLYKWNSAGNKACAVDLPFEQSVSSPGWDRRASLMAASSATDEFVFTHCVAYLRFTIDASSPRIVSFSATSGAGELVASRVTIVIADDNTVSVTEKTPESLQSQTATLSMENGGAFPVGTYYLAILPKTYADGFVFRFTDENGKTIERSVKENITMPAGSVGELGTVRADGIGSSINPLAPFDIFAPKVRVSILGDSISTYEGYIPADYSDAAYYPKENTTTGVKVDNVNQTYWYKLIYDKMSNAALEVNNSWRGTMVSLCPDDPSYEEKYFCHRFIDKGLGQPDVIIVHGGTNDVGKYSDAHSLAGQYKVDMYPDMYGMAPASLPTDAQFQEVFEAADAATTLDAAKKLEDKYFIHGYVKLITLIHVKYPKSKVVFIIPDGVTKRCMEAMKKILDYYGSRYGYRYVDLYNMTDEEKAGLTYVSKPHPDADGFTFMADKIYKEVGDYIDPK